MNEYRRFLTSHHFRQGLRHTYESMVIVSEKNPEAPFLIAGDEANPDQWTPDVLSATKYDSDAISEAGAKVNELRKQGIPVKLYLDFGMETKKEIPVPESVQESKSKKKLLKEESGTVRVTFDVTPEIIEMYPELGKIAAAGEQIEADVSYHVDATRYEQGTQYEIVADDAMVAGTKQNFRAVMNNDDLPAQWQKDVEDAVNAQEPDEPDPDVNRDVPPVPHFMR